MNRKRTPEELLAQSLGLFKEPRREQMDSASDRVRSLLRSEAERAQEEPAGTTAQLRIVPRPLRLLVAGAAIVFAVIVGGRVLQKRALKDGAVVVSASQIESHETFRSDNQTGMTLALPDDSRVEMRVQTELSFERAADGLRILLRDGSILVSAAKQHTGHLYVQTKDVSVSVVGTVFLVKAEPQGSRVAVIEGEVRVQNGATMEKLLHGEQVSTSSAMAARPIVEEISWSRYKAEHFVMLQQSAAVPAGGVAEPADRFEVASIRPSVAPTGSGARGGGGRASVNLPCPTANAFEMTQFTQLSPGRLLLRSQTLYALIALAYGHSCPAPDTMTGGLDWMRVDAFDVEAKIPAGAAVYTKEQMYNGNAPQLQRMMQNLLAERFNLMLKREVKETPGFNLVVAQQGKLKPSSDQTPDRAPSAPQRGGLRPVIAIPSVMAPISRLVSMLQRSMGRPIADKTGLTGLYDVWLEFPEIPMPTPDGTPADGVDPIQQVNSRVRDLLPAKLEAETGLKLEPATVPVQILVIVSAEKPSAN
jgi:uncharacterized protein (TIGR03435 family)